MTNSLTAIENLKSNPFIAFTLEYANNNSEEFHKLPSYTREYDNKTTKIPRHSDNISIDDISFFSNFGELAYNKFFKDKNITFNLKDHFYEDGKKLSEIDKNTFFNLFSEKNIKAEIVNNYFYFLDAYLHSPNEPKEYIMHMYTSIDNNTINIYGGESCEDCGARVHISYDVTTYQFVISHIFKDKTEKCKVRSDKEQLIKFKVNVPSGKLVFANDLRRILPKDKHSMIKQLIRKQSMNNFLGLKLCSELYANTFNLIYCYLESSSSIIKLSETEIMLASEYDYGFSVHNDSNWTFPKEQNKGSLETSLWAFNAIDYDEFVALTKDNDFEEEHFIVDIEAGEYEITHYATSKLNKPYFTKIIKI